MRRDSEAQRLQFILEGQQHADYFLTPLADPAGKTVLVLGSGAGTDVLWALRHGAREVVGIDVLEPDPGALFAAASRYGVDADRASLQSLDLTQASRLGRRFDLVLSNNVFEHVADLPGAFAACAQAVEPGRGRVAIFSAPFYYSSGGSHLPTEPWEHLWGEPAALREKLLVSGKLPAGHPLEVLELTEYLDREICLNRARLIDYLEAIRRSGLSYLQLSAVPDRCLSQLPRYLDKIRGKLALDVTDLTVGGFGVELILPPEDAAGEAVYKPVAEARLDEERRQNGEQTELARQALEAATTEAAALRERVSRLEWDVAQLRAVIAEVEVSWSHRIGRAVTAPGRWVRSRVSRSHG
ncbi:MAG TPA: class I SAM-dependent methyltransferase [Thermoanaerobaculia bacterium]|nr:class I SAM-dependent methyltransferase [Thermoanaerobaculia bacterium]